MTANTCFIDTNVWLYRLFDDKNDYLSCDRLYKSVNIQGAIAYLNLSSPSAIAYFKSIIISAIACFKSIIISAIACFKSITIKCDRLYQSMIDYLRCNRLL
jgi:hypothetical protein